MFIMCIIVKPMFLLLFSCFFFVVLVCRLAACLSLTRSRAHSDDIFPTNMCTSRSICWPPFHLVERILLWKSTGTDRELAQHCEYYMLVCYRFDCLAWLCFALLILRSFNLLVNENWCTLCFCKHCTCCLLFGRLLLSFFLSASFLCVYFLLTSG